MPCSDYWFGLWAHKLHVKESLDKSWACWQTFTMACFSKVIYFSPILIVLFPFWFCWHQLSIESSVTAWHLTQKAVAIPKTTLITDVLVTDGTVDRLGTSLAKEHENYLFISCTAPKSPVALPHLHDTMGKPRPSRCPSKHQGDLGML